VKLPQNRNPKSYSCLS